MSDTKKVLRGFDLYDLSLTLFGLLAALTMSVGACLTEGYARGQALVLAAIFIWFVVMMIKTRFLNVK